MSEKASAKELEVRPVTRARAEDAVRRLHYSGKTVKNSCLHLGVFWRGRLEGALQFGPPMVKRQSLVLVPGTPWHGLLELNRLAFSEALPRNSESRALAVAMRLMRRHMPQVEVVQSFADATQCGDGTIYRAAGFELIRVTPNSTMWQLGEVRFTNIGFRTGSGVREKLRAELRRLGHGDQRVDVGQGGPRQLERFGAYKLPGFQVLYMRFLSPACRARLVEGPLPYSALDEAGARMYRGAARGRPG